MICEIKSWKSSYTVASLYDRFNVQDNFSILSYTIDLNIAEMLAEGNSIFQGDNGPVYRAKLVSEW